MGLFGLSLITSKKLKALNVEAEKASELGTSVLNLSSEKQRCTNMLFDYDLIIKSKDKELIKIGNDLSSARADLEAKTESIKRLADSVKKLTSSLVDSRSLFDKCSEDRNSLERKVDELEKKIFSLNSAKGGYIKKIKELGSTISSLNSALENEKRKSDTLIVDDEKKGSHECCCGNACKCHNNVEEYCPENDKVGTESSVVEKNEEDSASTIDSYSSSVEESRTDLEVEIDKISYNLVNSQEGDVIQNRNKKKRKRNR